MAGCRELEEQFGDVDEANATCRSRWRGGKNKCAAPLSGDRDGCEHGGGLEVLEVLEVLGGLEGLEGLEG